MELIVGMCLWGLLITVKLLNVKGTREENCDREVIYIMVVIADLNRVSAVVEMGNRLKSVKERNR